MVLARVINEYQHFPITSLSVFGDRQKAPHVTPHPLCLLPLSRSPFLNEEVGQVGLKILTG
jgi:hypothetical protein